MKFWNRLRSAFLAASLRATAGRRRHQTIKPGGEPWLYKAGGLAALLTLLLVLLDTVVTFLPGDTDAEPGSLEPSEWFAMLRLRPLLALRNLGLINVANLGLSLPLFAALYTAHRHVSGRSAGLAIVAQLLGAAVYIANNAAFPMRELSRRYAATQSDTERAELLSDGRAVLARGEDFTPGAFPGFLLASLASISMGFVVRGGRVLRSSTGWAGILGPGCLLIFTHG